MRVQFHAVGLEQDIQERTGAGFDAPATASVKARECLQRYFALLRHELASVQFSEAEALLLADATNGISFSADTARLLWAEVADAIALNKLDEKWGVGGDALVAKLRGFCPGQALAVADALERAWLKGTDMTDALREVKLIRDA
jgi:hypothetical protein